MVKKKLCKWCECDHEAKNECPPLAFMGISQFKKGQEFKVRGKNIQMRWCGDCILIWPGNKYEK